MMFAQELEAQDNLHNISQRTNYIVDWAERPINKQPRLVQKPSIAEERQEEVVQLPAVKKSLEINRQVSEKYNLKKYENRLKTINQIQYPLADHDMLQPEEYYVLSKKSSNPSSPPSPVFKRKVSMNTNPCRVIDVQFLNRKLQIFQRKHSQSQKNLNVRAQNPKVKYSPRSLNIKRNSKQNDDQNRKIVLNFQQLQQIKKMVSKNSKRYSIPHFHQVPQFHQLNL